MTTHVEEFAARLRALKDRSGRSYGQLATRLHLSTSTLHRYCNGAAVPTEYGPVERLARACGATPEELLTLHGLWRLADAARREPGRSAAEPAVTEPAAAPPAAEEPAAPRPVVAEPAVAAPAVAAPASAPEPAAEDGEPESWAPPESSGAPEGPPGRSRRTALILAAVLAIAAVAVLPVALRGRGGGGGDDARDAGATSPFTSHAGSSNAGAKPPGSATSTPTPTQTPTPTRPSSATSTHAPATTAPGEDTGPAPFQVNVLADNWDTQCGQWFLLQQQPGKVPPPPSLDQTNAWASALGGIPAGHLRLQLTAQTGATQPIVLHALYVHVVSSKPARKGVAYTPGSGCGGNLDPASFAVDLDAVTPRTKPVPGYVGSGTTRTRTDFPYRISATDPQVLDVDASTTDRDVSWYLELSWSSGNRSGKLTVNDHGRPFRTTGLKGETAYFYDGTAWSPTTADD